MIFQRICPSDVKSTQHDNECAYSDSIKHTLNKAGGLDILNNRSSDKQITSSSDICFQVSAEIGCSLSVSKQALRSK